MEVLTLQKTQVKEIADLLKSGKIGVLPSDTIYGLHCLATDTAATEKVAQLKGRPDDTKFITLISDPSEIAQFNITLGEFEKEQILKFWPGPNTLIFKDSAGDTKSFRIPANEFLLSLLALIGPLISTSANIHGQPAPLTVQDTIEAFGDNVDFYVDGGPLNNPPSSIYRVLESTLEKIR